MPPDSRPHGDTPRFRILLEDGSELPISTVEGLARRLVREDVLPDTPLYDAGTGGWAPARDSVVVRFILDEMEREGETSPPGWTTGAEAVDASPAPRADEATDFGLTLTEGFDQPSWSEPDDPEASDPPERPEDLEDWLTTTASGGLIGPDEGFSEGVEAIDPPNPRARSQDRRIATREPAGATSSGGSDATPPFSARSRTRAVLLLVGVVVGVAVTVVFLADGWGGEGAGGAPDPAGAMTVVGPVSTELPVPPDLEGLVEPGLGRFAVAIEEAVDSLRALHGLPGELPSDWLGGYYLAHAGEFPEIRSFWEGYERLVQDLRLLEDPIFADAVDASVQPILGDPDRAQRLESYMRARFGLAAPGRQERYDQLALTARHAVALHDFLGARQDDLMYTPALGPAMPRDPVLEVGSEDPEIRRGLEVHLDSLFTALDRARGGGPPSSAGLRAELFNDFGTF